ncbi:Phosphate starvation-inducible protein PhoH,predicted ATPase [Richelia intracellularis HM01]|nr:Phosphate starvation-inducible protein PhoH,predicted ATPase [Richelia intracellularis HM01]
MAAALTIQIPSIDSTIALAGYAGENLKIICNLTGANIVLRGQELLISGTPKQMEIAMNLVQTLENLWHVGSIISNADILTAYQALNTHREGELEDLQKRVFGKNSKG